MLALPASLTFADVPAVLAQLRQAIGQNGTELAVDGGALRQFDSSALALLLECRRQAEVAKRPLRFVALPQRLLDLAQMYGIAGLLDLAELSV